MQIRKISFQGAPEPPAPRRPGVEALVEFIERPEGSADPKKVAKKARQKLRKQIERRHPDAASPHGSTPPPAYSYGHSPGWQANYGHGHVRIHT